MSGGSYGYLFGWPDRDETPTHELGEMRARLAELGYSDAADEVGKIGEEHAATLARWDRLAGVMRAVEWLDSADDGPERVAQEMAEWRRSAVVTF